MPPMVVVFVLVDRDNDWNTAQFFRAASMVTLATIAAFARTREYPFASGLPERFIGCWEAVFGRFNFAAYGYRVERAARDWQRFHFFDYMGRVLMAAAQIEKIISRPRLAIGEQFSKAFRISINGQRWPCAD